jgi:hypothetical protein
MRIELTPAQIEEKLSSIESRYVKYKEKGLKKLEAKRVIEDMAFMCWVVAGMAEGITMLRELVAEVTAGPEIAQPGQLVGLDGRAISSESEPDIVVASV